MSEASRHAAPAKPFFEAFSCFPDEEQKLDLWNSNYSNFLAFRFEHQDVRGLLARNEESLGHFLLVRVGLLQQAPSLDFRGLRLIGRNKRRGEDETTRSY